MESKQCPRNTVDLIHVVRPRTRTYAFWPCSITDNLNKHVHFPAYLLHNNRLLVHHPFITHAKVCLSKIKKERTTGRQTRQVDARMVARLSLGFTNRLTNYHFINVGMLSIKL